MGIFSSIIIGLIGGLIYIYFVKYLVKQNSSHPIDDNTILRSLSMVQLHILYIFIIYGNVQSIDPMAGDRGINALLDDTFIGDIVGFFTDINTEPNYQVIAIVDEMQSSANAFLFFGLILCAIESLGLIRKRINRWVIECISIICTIASYLYLRKISLFQEEIFAQSKLEGIANYFNQSFIGAISWMEPVLNICIIVLIINHILQHNALNKYYGESKIKSPRHIIILIAISLGILYLFNKHFLNPEIIINNNDINQNEVYETVPKTDTNTGATQSSIGSRNDINSNAISIAEYHVPIPSTAKYQNISAEKGKIYFNNIEFELDIYKRAEGKNAKEIFNYADYVAARGGGFCIDNPQKEQYMIYGYGTDIYDTNKEGFRFIAEYPGSKHIISISSSDLKGQRDQVDYLLNNYLKKYTYDVSPVQKENLGEYMNNLLGNYPLDFLENNIIENRLINVVGKKMYHQICITFERIVPAKVSNYNGYNFIEIYGFNDEHDVTILYNPDTDNIQVQYMQRLNNESKQIFLENEYEYSPFVK